MTQSNKRPIDRMLHGVSTGHVKTVRDAWRELLAHAEQSTIDVRERILSSDWSTKPLGPSSAYFSTLLAALVELDSQQFEQVVAKLKKSNLHPLHLKTIKSVSKQVTGKPSTFIGSGVPVHIAATIQDRQAVIKCIKKWSQTKGISLDGVTRINVIERKLEHEYSAFYSVLFSGIVLTWPTGKAGIFRSWYQRLKVEFSFYHEVGHHVGGHLEGGQVESQEQEANEYARRILRNSRPFFSILVSVVRWVGKPMLRWLLTKGRVKHKS